MRRIIVIGGVAGGASAAARIRRLDGDAEIIIFEKGPHISFSNCSLPYYIGGVVASEDALLMMSPEAMKQRFNIDTRVMSEVTKIDRAARKVLVKNLQTGEEYQEAYDILIIATGAAAIRPASIKGINSENVFTVKNVVDIARLKLKCSSAEKIAVIGGGFIGLEVAENLRLAGKSVVMIEGSNQVMQPLDYDLVQILHKELVDNGVELHLDAKLEAIEPDGIIVAEAQSSRVEVASGTVAADAAGIDKTQSSDAAASGAALTRKIPCDAVVLTIGVMPEKKLALDCGLECGRGIKVNHNYQTSDSCIYAVGDVIESYDSLALRNGGIALAGPAQRQARAAADHICGKNARNKGYISSSCLKLFNQNIAVTGLNEKRCKALGIPFDYVYILPSDKVGIMPDAHYICFKLLFEVPTGRILGAQAVGKGDVTKRIDVIASMITMNADLEDLKDLELCYAPGFNTAKTAENMAALVALNVLTARIKQVHVSDVRDLVESGAYIIDVREPGEYNKGHIVNAVNIPLSRFSERISEVPKDVPVYLHCRSSQRSYYAICQLLNAGYTNACNISGSFLGISLYEWYNDQRLSRTPIVTAYNFN